MNDRPTSEEFAPFYQNYVSLVPEQDVLSVLARQSVDLGALAATVPAARERYRYEPGKWTIREVFGHLGDAERVFGYRAFCISRGEEQSLPGFDENQYAAQAGADGRVVADLVHEFSDVRAANLDVLRQLDGAAWIRRGSANGSLVSVRALAFIMAGHVRHHLRVLGTRYGVQTGA